MSFLIGTGIWLAVLALGVGFLLWREHRRDQRDLMPRNSVDGRVDELAARRALRPEGQVDNVVFLHSRRPACGGFDRDGSAA